MISTEAVPWVLDDRRYPVAHVSLSNLPPHERANGVTLCHIHADLLRLSPDIVLPARVPKCATCVRELKALDRG